MTDIHPIHIQLDTIYVIKGEGTILVDCGDPQKINNFSRGLQKIHVEPKEIRLIILTHGHWDHVGSTKDLGAITPARMLLS